MILEDGSITINNTVKIILKANKINQERNNMMSQMTFNCLHLKKNKINKQDKMEMIKKVKKNNKWKLMKLMKKNKMNKSIKMKTQKSVKMKKKKKMANNQTKDQTKKMIKMNRKDKKNNLNHNLKLHFLSSKIRNLKMLFKKISLFKIIKHHQ